MAMFLHLALILGLAHMCLSAELPVCSSHIEKCLVSIGPSLKSLKDLNTQDMKAKCSTFPDCNMSALANCTKEIEVLLGSKGTSISLVLSQEDKKTVRILYDLCINGSLPAPSPAPSTAPPAPGATPKGSGTALSSAHSPGLTALLLPVTGLLLLAVLKA